jgi:hypothetical protein
MTTTALAPTIPQDSEAAPSAEMALERGRDLAYEAYNEPAFRHFLAIERGRAGRAGRSMMLLLVEFKTERQGDALIDPALASKLFAALTVCVREIDFIGWYRSGRVVGAVLTQGSEAPAQDVSQQIGSRVAQVLSGRLPAQIRRRLQVRVLQMHSSAKS